MRSPETAEQREKRLTSRAEYRAKNRELLNAKAAEYRAANRDRCYAVTKQWQEKHPERMKEIKKANYARHRDRYSRANREYMRKHPEKRSQYQRKYFEANRDVILRNIAAWHAKNPESRQHASHVRRAKMRGATVGKPCDIKRWMKSIRQSRKVKCHWCGSHASGKRIHFDHVVPIARGGSHSVDNLCASCPDCNQQKFAKTPERFNKELQQPLLFI